MSLGYDRPLYLLAFDHRGSFEKGLFGTEAPVSAQVKSGIIDAKELIFDAHLEVVQNGRMPPEAAGVLVDEEFGVSVARRAKAEGTPLAMPVEKSGQDEFQFEYGDDFAQHIEAFDPTFAKVLVRYNPEGDVRAEQASERAPGPALAVASRARAQFPLRAPGAPYNRAARPLRRHWDL